LDNREREREKRNESWYYPILNSWRKLLIYGAAKDNLNSLVAYENGAVVAECLHSAGAFLKLIYRFELSPLTSQQTE
jgi:hypothetical protein